MEETPGPDTTAHGAEFELRVGAMAAGGGCVGRAPDGRVVFVRHAAPGEVVRARVTQETAHFFRADAVEIVEPSTERVVPPCPHAGPGRCGGCDWQHLSVEAQRRIKGELVGAQLRQLTGVARDVAVEELPGATDGLGWRTRIRFAVAGDGQIGLRRHRGHAVELVSACPVATAAVEAVGVERQCWPTAQEVEVMTGDAEGGSVVVSATTQPRRRPARRDRAARLAAAVEIDGGLVVDGLLQRGADHVVARVGRRRFRVSAGSFWQVHAAAPATLVDAVLAALDPRPGERVVDLYAGVGLFAAFLAEAVGPAGSVLAVEQSRSACADARVNLADLPHARVLARHVDARLVATKLETPDLVVLDPSRTGAGKETIQALAALEQPPRRCCYVACDAAALARDARVLLDARWALTGLRAFDLFPMTEHVELVATFEPPR